jgi:hypothetical protein
MNSPSLPAHGQDAASCKAGCIRLGPAKFMSAEPTGRADWRQARDAERGIRPAFQHPDVVLVEHGSGP